MKDQSTMLDLHRLRLLRELHRRGTITAVARALCFSPSTVSQQLATLERETGVRLLEPVGRRVRLTEPDVPYTTTDLQIHLRLVEEQLAAALVPELSGVRNRSSITVHQLPSTPVRQIFTAVRRGASEHPAVRAFITATTR